MNANAKRQALEAQLLEEKIIRKVHFAATVAARKALKKGKSIAKAKKMVEAAVNKVFDKEGVEKTDSNTEKNSIKELIDTAIEGIYGYTNNSYNTPKKTHNNTTKKTHNNTTKKTPTNLNNAIKYLQRKPKNPLAQEGGKKRSLTRKILRVPQGALNTSLSVVNTARKGTVKIVKRTGKGAFGITRSAINTGRNVTKNAVGTLGQIAIKTAKGLTRLVKNSINVAANITTGRAKRATRRRRS